MKPRYKHDCDSCTWLGTITYPAPLSDDSAPMRNADLYCCVKCIGGPSLIARYSSDGPDYASLSATFGGCDMYVGDDGKVYLT
jgi:hypothetical protein